MIFEAEVIEVKAKKTVSNDREFVLRLVTNDPACLKLQEYIAKDTVRIEVKE